MAISSGTSFFVSRVLRTVAASDSDVSVILISGFFSINPSIICCKISAFSVLVENNSNSTFAFSLPERPDSELSADAPALLSVPALPQPASRLPVIATVRPNAKNLFPIIIIPPFLTGVT